MRKLIVAFEKEALCDRLREILESTGEFVCLICHSAAQVRQTVIQLRLDLILCGFQLSGERCELLYPALPRRCAMLMAAPQSQLDLCVASGVFKLPVPFRRSELLVSVRRLARLARNGDAATRRTQEERVLVEQAKESLMFLNGMTEEQAHRFLQKRSMDRGTRLPDTARQVLEELSPHKGG